MPRKEQTVVFVPPVPAMRNELTNELVTLALVEQTGIGVEFLIVYAFWVDYSRGPLERGKAAPVGVSYRDCR